MKALSLWNPWAFLVGVGEKKIETRPWSTNVRGWIAIHATKAFPDDAIADCHREPFASVLKAHGIGQPADLPRGVIIAVALLHRVGRIVQRSDGAIYVEGHDLPTAGNELAFGNYAPGRFGWVFTNVRMLPEPIPARGLQMLWDVPADVAAMIDEQIGVAR